jgi:hypothetical protein
MADDLARRLKQPPAHGLHFRTLPSTTKRLGAKAEIQIVGQRADGEEYCRATEYGPRSAMKKAVTRKRPIF